MSDSDLEEIVTGLAASLQPIKRTNRDSSWWSKENQEITFNAEELRRVVDAAVSNPLAVQERNFESKLLEATNRLASAAVSSPQVEVFRDTEIDNSIGCNEPLDIVKSLPDFEGKHETYVSWRKAAHTAYKIVEQYQGSSKHYQALGIIRNKVKGSADMVLSSYDTPLNFKGLINRLDFTYADKRPIYLIEQELSTLRQGNMT